MGKAKAVTNAEQQRPMPPEGLGQFADGQDHFVTIVPAPELRDWIVKTFIEQDGRLFNIEHRHLLWARFECLWAAGTFEKQGRTVIGLTEEISFRVSGWPRWRQEQQLAEWFGQAGQPDYLITFAADWSREASDTDFCALVEHELYHIGQKHDKFGEPEFTSEGLPKLAIRGHDVEEFVGVVRRYGVGDRGGKVAELVAAANSRPEVSRAQVAMGCGTCHLKVA